MALTTKPGSPSAHATSRRGSPLPAVRMTLPRASREAGRPRRRPRMSSAAGSSRPATATTWRAASTSSPRVAGRRGTGARRRKRESVRSGRGLMPADSTPRWISNLRSPSLPFSSGSPRRRPSLPRPLSPRGREGRKTEESFFFIPSSPLGRGGVGEVRAGGGAALNEGKGVLIELESATDGFENRGSVIASKAPKANRPGKQKAPQQAGHASLGWLLGAGGAVLAFYAALRIGVDLPWGYDDYYHLGVARELGRRFPLRAFPWTAFSVLADHFADQEVLFHVLLLPIVRLPISKAALIGALLGQAFLIGSMAWFLRSQRVPGAAGWLLSLAALGPFFVLRIEQLRPHVWMLGFSVLVLGLLFRGARLWTLAAVCAVFGLTHTAGWLSI